MQNPSQNSSFFNAKFTGQAIASPTDLVKVQMQADGKRVLTGHARRYSGITDAFATIYRQVFHNNK